MNLKKKLALLCILCLGLFLWEAPIEYPCPTSPYPPPCPGPGYCTVYCCTVCVTGVGCFPVFYTIPCQNGELKSPMEVPKIFAYMMKPKVGLTKSGPGSKDIAAKLAALGKLDVLVGIPEAKASRQVQDVNNAELMYIHTHGSPINNVPPRPVIEPALAANRESILPQLAQAAQATVEGKPDEAMAHLQAAGIAGRNACIRWFDDPRNNWPPNAPSTIAKKGSSHPLIDTGQLRRAITYVVTKKDS